MIHWLTAQGRPFMPAHPLGQLVSGDKKDVIISHIIDSIANRVVIFGWYYPSGTYIQPMTDVHADIYMDYSHGIRLVQNNCMLNDTTPNNHSMHSGVRQFKPYFK